MTCMCFLSRPAVLAVALLVPCMCLGARTAEDEPSSEPRIVAIRAGFAGRFKVGCWTPIEVTVRAGAESLKARIELTALDGDAVPSRVHAPAGDGVAIEPGETRRISLYAKIGQLL